jgi:hypothetical protein
MRLQGATLIEPDRRSYRIRLSDKTSDLCPRKVIPSWASHGKSPI